MPANDIRPTGTTDPATGTTDEAVSADGSAASADGSESIEAKAARIERELEEEKRKNAQLLSEKSTVEQQREELYRQKAAAQSPPTAGADPDLATLTALNDTIVKFGPDSYEGRQAVISANLLMRNRKNEQAFAFRERLEDQLDAIDDEKERRAVRKAVREGKANSVEDALTLVRGSKSEQTISALERRIAELEAQAKGGGKEPLPTSNVSTATTSIPIDAATHKKAVSLERYSAIMAKGGPEAYQLQADIDAGRIPDPVFGAGR